MSIRHNIIIRITLFISLVSVGIIGCVSYQLPEVPHKDILSYKTYQSNNGVGVALDVFYQKKKLLEYFGADLLYYGILPIHVMIENNDAQPILVEKSNFIALNNFNVPIRHESPSLASSPIVKEQSDRNQSLLILGAFSPLLIALASPGLAAQDIDNQTVIYNISSKALHEKAIFKGDSDHGFLYFPLEMILSETNNLIIQAKLKYLSSNNINTFRFNIDISEITRRVDKLNKIRKSSK